MQHNPKKEETRRRRKTGRDPDGEDTMRGDRADSNTNLFHFGRHDLKSPSSFQKKIKTSRGNKCVTTISWSWKTPFPPLLLSARFPCLLTLSFPSVSAEAAAQTQAAILCSAVSSQTELATGIPEVGRCALQSKSETITRVRKSQLDGCVALTAAIYKTRVSLHMKQA